MINSIIASISITLDAEFNKDKSEDYEIHSEEIKQGLKEPCFFIQCLNPTTELFLGKRYFRQNQFCIQFFPATDKKQRECNEVAERMIWCLEYITVNGDLFRGTKMKHEVVDGILNFFVNYDCFVYRVEENTPMGEMISHIDVKEGD